MEDSPLNDIALVSDIAQLAVTVPVRGPGRPAARPPSTTYRADGIVDRPYIPGSLAEVQTQSPADLKGFLNYCIKMATQIIFVWFQPDRTTFFARDHASMTRVMAVLPGASATRHYVHPDGVMRYMTASTAKTVHNLINNKNHELLTLLCGQAESFDLQLKSTDGCITRSRCPAASEPDDRVLFDVRHLVETISTETHPVQFELSADMLKTIYNRAKTIECKQMVIIVDHAYLAGAPEYYLSIKYPSDNSVCCDDKLDPKIANLCVGPFEGKQFRTALFTEALHGLFATLDGNVRVMCSEVYDTIITSIDSKKKLKVYTCIQAPK